MRKIDKLLTNQYDNHVLPFLWMHGEEEEKIRTYMKQISDAGIGAVCIESRPHDEFLKEKWWQDVDVIIEECEKRGMKLWILDDKHFPTGYAAGEIKKNYPNLQKLYLRMKQYDFVGPQANAGILLNWTTVGRPNRTGDSKETDKCQDCIKAVIAAKKTGYDLIDENTLINLTEYIKEDVLYWDIPEGDWSFFAFYETKDGGETTTEGYLNPIVSEATDVLIDTVYEAHYSHYKDKFGTVIAGFFSDEPRFGNVKGPDAIIGKEMPLPWCHGFEALFAKKINLSEEDVIRYLPLLFREDTDLANRFRFNYMDLVTELYQKNFSERIGKWCRSHQVEYIGHVIEDNNAHARLGYGPGHFFRSMAGQDMAGIDVVLHQLMPQQDKGYFKAMTNTGWDGEFFHYALAKMGASLGHLDPKKEGRTMCEVFGAYGWSEGTKLMKWIADHMLVRGVNYFVPHAFTLKDFPDPDCPPHFYANGHNPQFPYFHLLVTHMNRLGFLLSGGKHCADIGVLYHAEAEWSGQAMLLQKVTRKLMEKQIEFDIVPRDFVNEATIKNGQYIINDQYFNTLIVPHAKRLPSDLLKRLLQMQQAGINVIYVDQLPNGISDDSSETILLKELAINAQLSSIDNLTKHLDQVKSQLKVNKELPYLRYYHYQETDGELFMLFNENTFEDISFNAIFPTKKQIKGYDPVLNEVKDLVKTKDGYAIALAKGESMIFFESDNEVLQSSIKRTKEIDETVLNEQNWKISFSGKGLTENSEKVIHTSILPILGNGDGYTNFIGKITFETTIKKSDFLTIENASEIVSVYLNDELVGTRISTPYHFKLPHEKQSEENSLKIEVVNNLGRNQKDFLSQFITIEPLGLIGKVTTSKSHLLEEEEK